MSFFQVVFRNIFNFCSFCWAQPPDPPVFGWRGKAPPQTLAVGGFSEGAAASRTPLVFFSPPLRSSSPCGRTAENGPTRATSIKHFCFRWRWWSADPNQKPFHKTLIMKNTVSWPKTVTVPVEQADRWKVEQRSWRTNSLHIDVPLDVLLCWCLYLVDSTWR